MHAKSSFFRSRDGRPQRRSNQLAPRSPQNGHSSPAPRNNSSSPSGLEEDLQDGTRLNKLIAASGYCSRRKADELIFAGAVQVNGVVERSPGRRILPDDLIQVEGQQLAALPASFSYIMLHKPIQVMCTAHDPQGRPTVLDCLTAEMRRNRVYPIGRLDYETSGLLILTNDGDLIQELTHPSVKVPKVYLVQVGGLLHPHQLETLAKGVEIEPGKTAYADIEVLEADNNHTMMQITLYQGLNRQIRKMFEYIGYEVKSLKRIQHATIQLTGLKRGEFKPIKPAQIKELRNFLNRLAKKS